MDEEKLKELWFDPGVTREGIAKALGVRRRQMETAAKNIGLPVRRARSVKTHGVSRERFEEVWMDYSLTKAEVSFKLGIPKSTCNDLCDAYGLPKGRDGRHWNNGNKGDPTPEEIRAACEEIQARWTEEDWNIRERRRSPGLCAFSYNGPMAGFLEVSVD